LRIVRFVPIPVGEPNMAILSALLWETATIDAFEFSRDISAGRFSYLDSLNRQKTTPIPMSIGVVLLTEIDENYCFVLQMMASLSYHDISGGDPYVR